MNDHPEKLQTSSMVVDILQLLMALKDAYNDVSRRHNRGDSVRRRVSNLRSNLKAVLDSDKSAPVVDPVTEEGDSKEDPQLPLPIGEQAQERRVPKAYSPIKGSKDPRNRQ